MKSPFFIGIFIKSGTEIRAPLRFRWFWSPKSPRPGRSAALPRRSSWQAADARGFQPLWAVECLLELGQFPSSFFVCLPQRGWTWSFVCMRQLYTFSENSHLCVCLCDKIWFYIVSMGYKQCIEIIISTDPICCESAMSKIPNHGGCGPPYHGTQADGFPKRSSSIWCLLLSSSKRGLCLQTDVNNSQALLWIRWHYNLGKEIGDLVEMLEMVPFCL